MLSLSRSLISMYCTEVIRATLRAGMGSKAGDSMRPCGCVAAGCPGVGTVKPIRSAGVEVPFSNARVMIYSETHWSISSACVEVLFRNIKMFYSET